MQFMQTWKDIHLYVEKNTTNIIIEYLINPAILKKILINKYETRSKYISVILESGICELYCKLNGSKNDACRKAFTTKNECAARMFLKNIYFISFEDVCTLGCVDLIKKKIDSSEDEYRENNCPHSFIESKNHRNCHVCRLLSGAIKLGKDENLDGLEAMINHPDLKKMNVKLNQVAEYFTVGLLYGNHTNLIMHFSHPTFLLTGYLGALKKYKGDNRNIKIKDNGLFQFLQHSQTSRYWNITYWIKGLMGSNMIRSFNYMFAQSRNLNFRSLSIIKDVNILKVVQHCSDATMMQAINTNNAPIICWLSKNQQARFINKVYAISRYDLIQKFDSESKYLNTGTRRQLKDYLVKGGYSTKWCLPVTCVDMCNISEGGHINLLKSEIDKHGMGTCTFESLDVIGEVACEFCTAKCESVGHLHDCWIGPIRVLLLNWIMYRRKSVRSIYFKCLKLLCVESMKRNKTWGVTIAIASYKDPIQTLNILNKLANFIPHGDALLLVGCEKKISKLVKCGIEGGAGHDIINEMLGRFCDDIYNREIHIMLNQNLTEICLLLETHATKCVKCGFDHQPKTKRACHQRNNAANLEKKQRELETQVLQIMNQTIENVSYGMPANFDYIKDANLYDL
jgi:hypothetical protein